MSGRDSDSSSLIGERDTNRRYMGYTAKHWAGFGFVLVILAVLITIIAVASKDRANADSLPSDPLARARYLQSKNPLIDGHNDLPWYTKHSMHHFCFRTPFIELDSFCVLK
jgi:hypothetical protein